MKFKHSKEFSIGLSVIIALVVVYFGIEYLKGNNIFKPANYYITTYEDVAGLQQSAPVTLNGFKVGLVRDIVYDYDNPGHINVELSLDKELRLPQGSKAMLVTDLLGTTSIDLRLSDSKNYQNVGDRIIGEREPSLMSGVSSDILPAVSAIIPKIDSLLTSLNTLASDPALSNSFGHLENAMSNISQSSIHLSQVMNKMPGIADDAQTAMTNVKYMSESLNTIAGDLTVVSSKLKEMPIDQTMENVYQTSITLKELMQQLKNPNSSLGMLLNDKQLYNNLSNASASLDSLLIDVKKNPKRYISIKLL